MKKVIVPIIVILLLVGCFFGYKTLKKPKKDPIITKIVLKSGDEVNFGSIVNTKNYVDSITDGKIIDEDITVDEYPTKDINIRYLDNNQDEHTKTITIKVIDIEKPIVMNAYTVTTYVGETPNFTGNVMIGDNADRNPKIDIIGDYDINRTGTYNLKYLVTDKADNSTEQWFKLSVINKNNNNNNSSSNYTNYSFDKFKNDYKNSSTKLGIDVSKWQGEINWQKVKDAGCEFAMIRIGYQTGINNDLQLDPYFERNIKEANKVGIPIGLYFYSYANSLDEATKQANWIINNIKNYKVDLPIAFDWENWTSFSEFSINFLDLNKIAQTFIDVLEENNYKGMLYSSKSYLDAIWNEFDNVWLAHYTTNTNYTGDYIIWQRSNIGKINGINADVDLDVMYIK